MYEKLHIHEFGEKLLTTNDLDPIYVALEKLSFKKTIDDEQLKRWLIAYWCFYSAPVACWMSELDGSPFWQEMWTAAENVRPSPLDGRWPRGKERRHFRGQIGMNSIMDLRERYLTRPAGMVEFIANGIEGPLGTEPPRPFRDVSGRAQRHSGFGPWIGFKVADMIDRCLNMKVDFDIRAVFMFDDPRKAALMVWDQYEAKRYPAGTNFKEDAIIQAVADHLTKYYNDLEYYAPPAYDRPLNIQEVETILCKWKSHMNGHYPVGNDVHEIRTALLPWAAKCETAHHFLAAMPSAENPCTTGHRG